MLISNFINQLDYYAAFRNCYTSVFNEFNDLKGLSAQF